MSNPRFISFSKKFRDEALVACISENYSEEMWKEYADKSTGFCAVYNTMELIVQSFKLGFIFYPVRYVESRCDCKDIYFSSEDYRDDDNSYDSYIRKHLLSCLTKSILPYSKEGEWRLLKFNTGITEDEKGKTYPFIMPRLIIIGKEMKRGSEVYESLVEFSSKHGIKILEG